jgi:dynein heavy chain
MITACKSYITVNGSQNIWVQSQDEVMRKLNDCIRLNEEYQSYFQRTKDKLANTPNEKPFDFSEMYIFGKFDTFVKRCKKIIDIFKTISTYSNLQESKIEGKSVQSSVLTNCY